MKRNWLTSSKVCPVRETGPLTALGLIGRLNLLENRFGEVWIPRAVEREIIAGGIADSLLIAIHQSTCLKVADLSLPLNSALLALLDQGEAEVLALAAERKITSVLLDERKGRKVARTIMGLQPIGTARLLVDAQLSGQLPAAAAELRRLREAGYWLDDAILEWAMHAVGESPPVA